MRKSTSLMAAALCFALGMVAAGAQTLSVAPVQPVPVLANNWVDSISPAGIAHQSQPNFSNLAGNWTLSQGPTLGADTVLGSIAGGLPAQLTQTQLTSLINQATASLPGAMPAWPNTTTTFLRGDDTFATLNFAAVSGSLGLSQVVTGTQDTILGYFGSTTLSAGPMVNCANALIYNASTHAFGCNSAAGTGTVTTAGIGLSLTGGGSTLNLELTNATLQSPPAGMNPAGNATTTFLMAGMGSTCQVTLGYENRFQLTFSGNINASGGFQSAFEIYYGTGTPPTNGHAVIGTQIGAPMTVAGSGSSNLSTQTSQSVNITGLTPGQTYWFDLAQKTNNAANTAVINNAGCNGNGY
jgi:hypothetical protein